MNIKFTNYDNFRGGASLKLSLTNRGSLLLEGER